LEVQNFEPKTDVEKRKAFGSTVEMILAQKIYSDVIQSLVECQKDEDGTALLKFGKEDIDWLGNTFTRGNLGSRTEAYVCLFPTYDIIRDENQRMKKRRDKAQKLDNAHREHDRMKREQERNGPFE
jgi:hypothetical protein